MLLHLAEQLDVPLRERNVLLAAAGYAAVFRERSLKGPGTRRGPYRDRLGAGRTRTLPGNRRRSPLEAGVGQQGVGLLLAGVDQNLLRQPVNALRLALHPNGLAPRTVNLAEWRAHLLARLRRQIELTADPDLIELLNELQKYPAARSAKPPSSAPPDAAVVLRRTSSVRWCVLRDRVPTSLVSSPRRLHNR
jgi:hypothetical protein